MSIKEGPYMRGEDLDDLSKVLKSLNSLNEENEELVKKIINGHYNHPLQQ